MKKAAPLVILLATALFIYSCKKEKSVADAKVATNVKLDLPKNTAEYYLNTSAANVSYNQKATVGRVLFYDTRLSVNNAVSCASCHKQSLAFADNSRFSRGFDNRLTGRNSPTIQNLLPPLIMNGQNIKEILMPLFWDGRETNIMNLIARPISNHVEMGIDNPETLAEKISALDYYKDIFAAAYPDGNISFDRIAECITYFIAAIRADNSRFDKYSKGEAELSALELYGQRLFIQKYNCAACHSFSSPYFSSGIFANIGLDEVYTDRGRGAISKLPEDNGKFKVPVLRNVALTAPYMHDGRFNTLEEVLDHYSEGIKDNSNLDENLRDQYGKPMKMHISDMEKQALIAFLKTMTDYDLLTDPKFSNPFIAN